MAKIQLWPVIKLSLRQTKKLMAPVQINRAFNRKDPLCEYLRRTKSARN